MSDDAKEALRQFLADQEGVPNISSGNESPAGPYVRFHKRPIEGAFTLQNAVDYLVNELALLGEGDVVNGGRHIAFVFYATAIADLEHLIEHGTSLRETHSPQERGARAASILRQIFLEDN